MTFPDRRPAHAAHPHGRRRRREHRRDRARSTSTPRTSRRSRARSSLDVARPGAEFTLAAYGTDADGTIASYAFDLDGNGTYETRQRHGRVSSTTSFSTAGTKLVGVRVTDSDGATATSRRTIEVKEGNDPPSVRIYRTSVPQLLLRRAPDPDGAIAQYAWDLDDDGVFDDPSDQLDRARVPRARFGTSEVRSA